ncbi:hypothetical protein [Leucobacter aridicollis]|uniref:hypothetical protein n=1 Tax=Leucobacter aridicollis TaxID=283878 RepID=UPI00216A04BB|nr:hypothetical protein [Leucobacter aridicollis]MCS3429405.1 hypothetical protein [Leucobacter aridicollis]
MADSLRLTGAALDEATERLSGAVIDMRESTPLRHRAMPTLTGVSAEIDRFTQGLAIAQAALSDAARSALVTIAGLRESGADLDVLLAAALAGGPTLVGDSR